MTYCYSLLLQKIWTLMISVQPFYVNVTVLKLQQYDPYGCARNFIVSSDNKAYNFSLNAVSSLF